MRATRRRLFGLLAAAPAAVVAAPAVADGRWSIKYVGARGPEVMLPTHLEGRWRRVADEELRHLCQLIADHRRDWAAKHPTEAQLAATLGIVGAA